MHVSIHSATAQTAQFENLKNDVEKLFNRKDKGKTGTETLQTGVEKKRGALESSPDNSNSLKPGDVAPNAKVIDADYLYPFNRGAAVVRKGDAIALIDKNGNFIVPYNKYNIRNVGDGKQGGIFFITQKNEISEMKDISGVTGMGAINSNGKLITSDLPNLEWWNGAKDCSLIYAYDAKSHNNIYLDASGHKYVLKEDSRYTVTDHEFSEGALRVQDRTAYKYGYKNLTDEWIIKPVYDQAEPFSEGLACVGKKNEFGEIKYGFIDKTGKEVIGLIYSRKPDNFHGGLSRINPKDMTEFKEVFVDTKGAIVQKLPAIGNFTYIGNGIYARTRDVAQVMDSEGEISSLNDFLKGYGVVFNQSADKAFSITGNNKPWYNDNKICFVRTARQSGIAPRTGYIDLKTRKVMEGSFTMQTSLHFCDLVSGLALAQFYITGKIDNSIREGYVNEEGVFVIVKGEGAKW